MDWSVNSSVRIFFFFFKQQQQVNVAPPPPPAGPSPLLFFPPIYFCYLFHFMRYLCLLQYTHRHSDTGYVTLLCFLQMTRPQFQRNGGKYLYIHIFFLLYRAETLWIAWRCIKCFPSTIYTSPLLLFTPTPTMKKWRWSLAWVHSSMLTWFVRCQFWRYL